MRNRIIPADAGSTRHYRESMGAGRDHPRGCGEHCLLAEPVRVLGGSSPRMRGALISHPVHERRAGIIPADAGSTSATTSTSF